MTDLQMGLIGLGGTAVIGVLAYNKWQEHKHRKLAEQLLNGRQTDVLLDEPRSEETADERADSDARVAATARSGDDRVEPLLRQEPVFAAPAADRLARTEESAVASPPAFLSSSDAVAPRRSAPAESVRPADGRTDAREIAATLYRLSPLIDYIAAIEVSEPAAAYRIHDLQRVALERVGKPLNWICLLYTSTARATARD